MIFENSDEEEEENAPLLVRNLNDDCNALRHTSRPVSRSMSDLNGGARPLSALIGSYSDSSGQHCHRDEEIDAQKQTFAKARRKLLFAAIFCLLFTAFEAAGKEQLFSNLISFLVVLLVQCMYVSVSSTKMADFWH